MSSFMSFLTLGLTADAAAAHRHEFSDASTVSSYRGQSLGSRTLRDSPPLTTLTTIVSQSTPKLVPTTTTPTAHEPRSKPKPQKTKTSYHLAAPPPSHHSPRIHSVVRPSRALILQLQRLHASTRPLPSYDVIPALAFATRPKRKRPIGLRSLGLHDLVIVSSEEYADQGNDGIYEDEDLSGRNFVASLSPVSKKDKEEDGLKALLELAGGTMWEASQKSNGSYEFVRRHDNGETLVARWILRIPNTRRRSSQMASAARDNKLSTVGEKKFQFSMINSNTRKHPILASMIGQRIDIWDQYSVPTSITSRPSSPGELSRTEAMSTHSISDVESERVLVQTEEDIKTLIIVTGTWVALFEGFNGRSWFDESAITPSPVRTSGAFKTQVLSTESSPLGEKRSLDVPTDKGLRRGAALSHKATTGGNKPIEDETGSLSTRRSNSTGNAYMRPVRNSASLMPCKLGSTRASPVSTRAPSPEPAATFSPIIEVQNAPSVIPPTGRATSAEAHCAHNSPSDPIPNTVQPTPKKEAKPKMDRWRRKSLPPRVQSVVAEPEKKSLKQKLSRVFSLLRKNNGSSL
ncbi:hypothetical protein BDZ91DRAFT_398612 [Kalaharituber pfeilii]|nr:hypothetical protein BDZ91DRAFT_398612 [Kalaharituber pfeilii]